MARTGQPITYSYRAARGVQPIDGARARYPVKGKPGLYLQVSPGKPDLKRVWYVRYQVGAGKKRRLGFDSIGDIAHWTIGQAWDRATEIIRGAQSGIDPKAAELETQATEEAAARTVDSAFAEWIDHPGRKRVLRPVTREHYKRIQRLYITPRLGNVPLSQLSKEAVEAAVEAVRVASTDPAKNKRGLVATKALRQVRHICGFAIRQGYIEIDPTQRVQDPVPMDNPAGRAHRPPTDAELRLIWNEAPNHIAPQSLRVLKLAILLGKRVLSKSVVRSQACGSAAF